VRNFRCVRYDRTAVPEELMRKLRNETKRTPDGTSLSVSTGCNKSWSGVLDLSFGLRLSHPRFRRSIAG
jgi:hypothetical protein